MALGKKIIDWTYADMIKGQSSSDVLGDGGFSPATDGIQLLAVNGVAYNPPVPTDFSAGLTGQLIASCEDPTGNYSRLFVSIDGSQHGRFYSMNGAYTLTQRGSTDSSHTYVQGKTDMIAFDGEAYITSSSTLVRWSSIGSSDTFNTAFFAFTDAFSPHPALVFNNFAYYGDGNVLYRQASAGATPGAILTLPTQLVIVALAIDPGSGQMLISVIGQINLSDTVNSVATISFYDGFSSQVSRSVQVDDMVTAFAPTEGSLYCSYGQNLGLWNGSGVTFLRRFNVGFDNTQLMYKQHFTSIGSTLLFVERARVIAHGPVRQKGDNIFYPVLTNTINGADTDLTHIVNLGQNQMGMSYADSQFAVFDSIGEEANKQDIFSNNYNFDDEVWLRRARLIYDNKVANGASPGVLRLYNEDGLITETADSGEYSLLNDKGFSSAVKDINNLNLRVKQVTFELDLNETTGPSLDGSVTTAQSHASVNTFSFTHSVAAGLSNPLVLIMVASPQNTNPTGTLNGGALNTHVFNASGYDCTLLWGTPLAGSNAIVLNWSIASTNIAISAVTVKNAGTPFAFAQNFSDTATPSVTLTSTVQKSLYFEFFMTTSGITVTTPSGQTELANFLVATSSIPYQSSYKTGAYPGTTSMTVGMNTDASMQINGFVVPPLGTPINPGIQRVVFYGDPANVN